MAKQAHRLSNTSVADYLSKWTDAARVNLLKSDIFTGFYFISSIKKLRLMLLPIMEKRTDGNDTIIGTSSNSASTFKLTKIKATTVGTSSCCFPARPPWDHSLKDQISCAPADCANIDSFKFVKLPNFFPIPYGTTAIKGSLSDNSVCDASCNISKTTGPLWEKLITAWSKPFADAVLNNPTTTALLPPLKKDQQWTSTALIQNEGLTDDKEDEWAAIMAITDVITHLLESNVAAPTTSLILISTMAHKQSVLTMDSTPKDTTPIKQNQHRLPTILQSDTQRAKFRIIFAAFDGTTGSITPPILTYTVEETNAMDSASTRISSLSSAINNLLNVVSSKQDFISRNVCWPSNLSTLSNGLLAQGLL